MNSLSANDCISLVQSLPVEIAFLDTSFNYKLITNKWKEAYHLPSTNISNISFFESNPVFTETWIPTFYTVISEQKQWIEEMQIEKLNSTVVWIKVIIQPTYNSLHQVDGLSVQTENISAQKKEQEFLENTNSVARVGGWEFNLKTNALYWSPVTKEILGVSAGFEPTLVDAFNFYKVGKNRELIIEAVNNAIMHGTSYELDLQITNTSKKTIWVRSKGNAEHRNGTCVRLFGTFQDITKEKELQENLHIQETRFRSTFENAVLGVAILSVDYRWLEVNKSLCNMVGYASTELINTRFYSIMHASDIEQTKRTLNKFLSSEKENIEFEIRFIHKNESIVFVNIVLTIVKDENGLPLYFTAQIENITKRKQIEDSFKTSELKYSKLFELLPVGVSLVNHENRLLVEFNNTILKKLGYTKEEFLQLTFRGIEVEGFEETDKKQLESIHNTGKYGPYEKKYYRKDGTVCTMLLNGLLIEGSNEQKLVLSTFQDITDLKEKERQLLQLNNLLDMQKQALEEANIAAEQFNYVASHDLNEPLRMITGFLELLQKKYAHQFDEKASSYIHFALDGSIRMQNLIKDLLQYSRVGKESSKLEILQLPKILEEVKDNLYRQIKDNNASIQIDIEDNLQLKGYPPQLVRLFQNLISNAIKFKKVKNSPSIIIAAKNEDSFVTFSIKDDGIGIPTNSLQKIFDVFTRLHHKNTYAGTGIGLAICKKIVEKHNGKIWVESKENEGSTFYFTISKTLSETNEL